MRIKNMKVIIKPCDGMPCTLGQFIVNSIKADVDDFGYMDWEDGEFYECINHRFIGFDKPKAEVLKKYNINETEFESICYKLQKALYIDSCQRCR